MLASILFIFMAFHPAQAQELEAEIDPNVFRSQVEQLNARYEDFFAHEQRLRLYEDNLKRSIPDLKSQRQSYESEAAIALREYRQQRKAKVDDSLLELQDQKEKKAQSLQQDRQRRDYISRREQLRRISESARKVPANRDAGLE